jgi:hypothetical protein
MDHGSGPHAFDRGAHTGLVAHVQLDPVDGLGAVRCAREVGGRQWAALRLTQQLAS